MRKRFGSILWGVVFIAVGILWLFSIFTGWKITAFPGWWTLFLMVPAVISMITDGIRLGNVILFLIGGAFLVKELDVFPGINIAALGLAVAVILIGLKILFRRNSEHPVKGLFVSNESAADEYLEYISVFGGLETRNTSQDLKGGSVTAIFGGSEVDLTEAKINRDIVIDAVAIFGGITIYAPKKAKVVVTGVPIFGGYSNKTEDTGEEALGTVKINCVSIFGGVEVAPHK